MINIAKPFTRLNSVFRDEDKEEILEQLIFSGDIAGYMQRNYKSVVTSEFADFLDTKVKSSDDDDEKATLEDVRNSILDALSKSDGLDNSVSVFEERLNRILYTAPNQRLKYVKEKVNDMTPGFIEYVQSELRNEKSIESKVVYASILQMIGEAKGTDLLGKYFILNWISF
jgi:hypothetical protein